MWRRRGFDATMTRRILLTALLAWLGIAVAAILNGTLREAILIPAVGNTVAQLVSILLLLSVIVAVTWLLARGPWRALPPATLLAIGAAWAVGTMLFELALGRLVLAMPWSALLGAYDVRTGTLWPLVPLAMLAGPVLLAHAEAKRASKGKVMHPSRLSRRA